MGKLHPRIAQQAAGVLDAMESGDHSGLQTHALNGPLKGYYSTALSDGHRIVHTSLNKPEIDVHYVGHHDYSQAVRRIAEFQGCPPEGVGSDHMHLQNPADKSFDWHHGTPHKFESFDSEPDEDEGSWWDDGDRPDPHWNTHLGQHWTSLRGVADQFARGKYHNAGGPEGYVHTAQLGIQQPRVYQRESDMDKEAFEHAWPKGTAQDWDPEQRHYDHCDKPGECYGLEDHPDDDPIHAKIRNGYRNGSESYWLSSHPEAWMNAGAFKDHLQRQGHDGVVYGNEVEGPHGHACAITFDTNQIHNRRVSPIREPSYASIVRAVYGDDVPSFPGKHDEQLMLHPELGHGMEEHGLYKGSPQLPLYRAVQLPSHPVVDHLGESPEHDQAIARHFVGQAVQGYNDRGHRTTLGIHWSHDPEFTMDVANTAHCENWGGHGDYSHAVMLEADHPGHEHVLDFSDASKDPKHPDHRVLNNTISPHEYHHAMLPEVPIRPGAPMHLRAIHVQKENGDFHRIPVGLQTQARKDTMDVEAAGPRHENPADHPFYQANPVSAQNVLDHWHAATPEEHAQGMRWYADGHILAKALGHNYGDRAAHVGAGVLSAYSPQAPWIANVYNAARSLHEGRALGPGEGVAIMGMHKNQAQRIIDGEPHQSVLNAPKTHHFATLLEHGGDAGDGQRRVVMDRHAMSVALGHNDWDDAKVKQVLGNPHYYEHAAQTYRDAADHLTSTTGRPIAPHQVQAVTWLARQRLNAQQTLASGDPQAIRSLKGRETAQENIVPKWRDHMENAGVPISPEDNNQHRFDGPYRRFTPRTRSAAINASVYDLERPMTDADWADIESAWGGHSGYGDTPLPRTKHQDVDLGRHQQYLDAEQATNGHFYRPDYTGRQDPHEHFFGPRFREDLASEELKNHWRDSGQVSIRHAGSLDYAVYDDWD